MGPPNGFRYADSKAIPRVSVFIEFPLETVTCASPLKSAGIAPVQPAVHPRGRDTAGVIPTIATVPFTSSWRPCETVVLRSKVAEPVALSPDTDAVRL